MIAIDTNVLVRYLVQDDPAQSEAAARLIEGELSADRPGFVSLPVVCEVSWVLRTQYKFERRRVAAVLASLLEVVQLEFEEPDVMTAALSGGGEIADAIIHQIGRARGCEATITFDRQFARLDGVTLLTA